MCNSNGIYRDLHICQNKVESLIDEYLKLNYSEFTLDGPEIKNKSNHLHRYTIQVDGNTYLFDCFYNPNKGTTIMPTGKQKKDLIPLSDFIFERRDFKEVTDKVFTIPNFSIKYYDEIIEFLSSLDDVRLEEKNEKNKKCYKFSSNIGDSLTLSYFCSTNKFMLQGKVMKLFNDVSFLLSQYDTINEKVIVNLNEAMYDCSIDDVTKANMNLKTFLPVAYDHLNPTIIRIIKPSLIFVDNNVDLNDSDHTGLVHPVTRGLEAVLKSILLSYNISINHKNNENFGKVFTTNLQGKTILRNAFFNNINDIKTRNELCKLYEYFKKNRHIIEHTDINVVTTTIFDKSTAYAKIYETLEAIELFYSRTS